MKRNCMKIGIIGLGTVGGGVVGMLRRNRAAARACCGLDVDVQCVSDLDVKRLKATGLPSQSLTRDYHKIISDPEIKIVVELVGGTGVAREVVTGALRAGKHVVTANKALIANHWTELFTLAHEKKRALGFEASVMAGVPVIRAIEDGLAGNVVRAIHGILNGTSNFIITRMFSDGMDFQSAIGEARQRGLCEADASLDTEGHDAQQKLSILASIALGQWLPPSAILREGISHIEKIDLIEAHEEFGYVLRPLAVFKRLAKGIEARVHPTFIPMTHPLAAVTDEFNAALINADHAGAVVLTGKGAGERPAASGVVSDILSIARTISNNGDDGFIKPPPETLKKLAIAPAADIECKFYLRFSVMDQPGVLSFISGELGRQGVSIASCHQRVRSQHGPVPVVIITHAAREGALRKALASIDSRTRVVKRKTVTIRIEE